MVSLRGLDAEPANAKILHYMENISQTDTFIIVSFLINLLPICLHKFKYIFLVRIFFFRTLSLKKTKLY